MLRLLVLFFASGCAALIYETVWFYLVQLVVGASSISVAVLLCAFMGGMALGSWLLPKVTPKGWHPFRVVAALEAGIGIIGITIPLALPYIQRVYLTLASPAPARAVARGRLLPGPHAADDVDGRHAAGHRAVEVARS
jgi:spermidine synthase